MSDDAGYRFTKFVEDIQAGRKPNPFDKFFFDLESLLPDGEDDSSVERHLVKAEEYYKAGRYENAMLLLWDAGRLATTHTKLSMNEVIRQVQEQAIEDAPKHMRKRPRRKQKKTMRDRVGEIFNRLYQSDLSFRKLDDNSQELKIIEAFPEGERRPTQDTVETYLRAKRRAEKGTHRSA